MSFKWTNGTQCERSKRLYIKEVDDARNKEIEKNAYLSSLNYDENTWDILNKTNSGVGLGFKISNKREEIGQKLQEREMIQQIGYNPFLGNQNYLNDVETRDRFMKPQNTTFN